MWHEDPQPGGFLLEQEEAVGQSGLHLSPHQPHDGQVTGPLLNLGLPKVQRKVLEHLDGTVS